MMTTRAITAPGRGAPTGLSGALGGALSAHGVDPRTDVAALARAAAMMVRCFGSGGKLLIFGNGGSAACAQHLAAELVGRLRLTRPPLAAIALAADATVMTAIANDFGFDEVFARQVRALGRAGDVAMAISTSGTSANVLAGLAVARQLELGTIALTGPAPSPLGRLAEVEVAVDAATTARIQEVHLAVQHALAASVEAVMFEGELDGTASGWAPCRRGVVGWDDLLRARAIWRRHGREVVLVHGPFEVLEPGQLYGLASASRLGDVTIAGVYADHLPHGGGATVGPSLSAPRRAEAIAAVGLVDHVVVVSDPAWVARLEPEFCLDLGTLGVDDSAAGGDATR